jgi:hypothetical protein
MLSNNSEVFFTKSPYLRYFGSKISFINLLFFIIFYSSSLINYYQMCFYLVYWKNILLVKCYFISFDDHSVYCFTLYWYFWDWEIWFKTNLLPLYSNCIILVPKDSSAISDLLIIKLLLWYWFWVWKWF